jgi:transcriptional regulator with XRE-family HTH domain
MHYRGGVKTREGRKQTVGDMIRLARVAQHYKQVDIARLILTTQPMISAFENNVAVPSQQMRKRLEEVLGIPESMYEESTD